MQRFSGTLSKGFVLGKPITQENYDMQAVYALDGEGKLICTRKRDGWKLFAAIGKDGKVRFYTDGMNEIVDRRFDHIKIEILRLNPPRCSLLVGEILMEDKDRNDVLGLIQSVCGAGYEKSVATQAAHGPAKYMLFDILFWDGQRLEEGFRDRLTLMDALTGFDAKGPLLPLEVLDGEVDDNIATVRAMKWEGMVIYREDFVNVIRTDGKAPNRPKGCWKWKPIDPADCIVRETTKREDGKTVKDLVLLQIDPGSGKEFYVGKVGAFTKEMRRFLSEDARYPLVVEALYESRYPKTGKLRSPRFKTIRDDKPAEYCLAPASYPEAEFDR